jgi:cation diffusion facilitator CzcD-associated flavoprotein CzcO
MVLEPLSRRPLWRRKCGLFILFRRDLQNDWTWSERFAAQPEILAYLEHVADRFDLRHHYLFDTEVVGARFGDAGGAWVVETSAPPRAAPILCDWVFVGRQPARIRGLADFAGEVYYRAAWPREDPKLRGKKVGVIGTGSSGIQAVPILAAEAESLVVFQRSPNSTVPMPNYP